MYQASVVVCSDTCSKNASLDESGNCVQGLLRKTNLFSQVNKFVVQDDKRLITETVKKTIDIKDNALTITVGGTGLCPRDVTPEATSILYERHCNSIVTAILAASLRYTPMAALSRMTAGIVGNCFVINFPGKTKACKECFDCLNQFLKHLLEQVRFDPVSIKATHKAQELSPKSNTSGASLASSSPTSVKTRLTVLSPKQGVTPTCELLRDISLDSPKASKNPQIHQDNGVSLKVVSSSTGVDLEKSKTLTNYSDSATKSLVSDSAYPMVNYEQALQILYHVSGSPYQKRKVKLKSISDTRLLLGALLAESITTACMIPPVPVSTMDGYVLNIPPGFSKTIRLVKKIRAKLLPSIVAFRAMQQDEKACNNFFCYQINTGGQVPDERFVVVPVEATQIDNDESVTILGGLEVDKFVRKPGSDVGQTDVLESGTALGPIEIGLILSMGRKEVQVYNKPTIGILSTGDELVGYIVAKSPKEAVIDVNGPILFNLFRSRGYRVQERGISRDNPSDIALNISTSLLQSDVLIVTGGASMGSKDHVKDVIESLGGIIHFGRVKMKPGKPVAFATVASNGATKFIFSLPGNPVSAYITALTLVIPFLKYKYGAKCNSKGAPSLLDIGVTFPVRIDKITDGVTYELDDRQEFIRAKIIEGSKQITGYEHEKVHSVEVSVKQRSSRLMSLKDCDCLIIVPAHLKGQLRVGNEYTAVGV